jgi:hypothetical protein
MSEELHTVAEIVKAVSAGRLGFKEAIRRLHLNTYDELVETVHLNGYTMPGHRAFGDRVANARIIAEACGRTFHDLDRNQAVSADRRASR